jgi:hypothetical protein
MNAERRIVTLVLLLLAAVFLVTGVVLGIALGPVFLLAFGGTALVLLAVQSIHWLSWSRRDARRRALLATGLRVPATLVSSRPTNNRVDDRVVQAHVFESSSAGRVVRAKARSFTRLPMGTEATIAYDAADPAKATVVEDLDRIAADWQIDKA